MLSDWHELTEYLRQTFSMKGDLLSALFLVGIHESGSGFRQYSQDEKTGLVKLAEHILLSRAGYYKKIEIEGRDPTFVPNDDHPVPTDPDKLDALLQKEILTYFNQNITSS